MSGQNSSCLELEDSGIAMESSCSMDGCKNTSSLIFTEAERDLHDLNLRLANCIDKAAVINMKNESTEKEYLCSTQSTQELGEKVAQMRRIYDKDIARATQKLQELHKQLETQLQTNQKLSHEYETLKANWNVNASQIKDLTAKVTLKDNQMVKALCRITSLKEALKANTKKYSETNREVNRLQKKVGMLELVGVEKDAELTVLKEAVSTEKSGRLLDREVYLKCEKEYLEQIKRLEQSLSYRDSALNESESFTVNKLNELREEFENEFLQHHSEIQSLYMEKCATLEAAFNHRTEENVRIKGALEEIQPKYQSARLQLTELKNKVGSLTAQIDEITRCHTKKEDFYRDKIDSLEKLLDRFTLNFTHLSNEYNASVDNQLFQSSQLKTLGKLIESEEHRLSIGPTNKPHKRKSSLLVDKTSSMLDIDVVNNNKHSLIIHDWSFQYEYIALKNISQNPVTCDGYYIETVDEEGEIKRFDLDSSLKLDANEFIRVFSENSNCAFVTNNDVVAKSVNSWFEIRGKSYGYKWKITLKDSQNKELSHLDIGIKKNENSRKKFLTLQGPVNSKRTNCVLL